MATRYQQEQLQREDFLRSLASKKPFIWLHRPKWLHANNDTGEPCPCCGSTYAIRVTDEPYLDLLVSRETGTRRLLQNAKDPDAWYDLASHAQRIDIPFRCHEKQWEVSQAKPKILLVSGGVGGGKSAVGANISADEIIARGGNGAEVWWVAPQLNHLEIALKKLFHGDFSQGREEPPIFPPEFVKRAPLKPTQKDLTATLLDGSKIRFWHAANEGQFKGQQPQLVVVDEGAEIRDRAILAQLEERTMRSNGRIVIPTTPKIPSPVKEIRDDGIRLDMWDGEYAAKCWSHFTSFDNPWIPDEWIENRIKTNMRGDATRIRREIHGEWISDGAQLWRQYDPEIHLRGGTWESVEALGLRNITEFAARRFFRKSSAPLDVIAGQDFNLDPMSLVVAQIACLPEADETKPENWIFVAIDEVVETSSIFDFPDLLSERGYYELAIACDPSGAQQKEWIGFNLKKGSTLANEMRRRGYDCRPASRSASGNPDHEPVKDRINRAHKLMFDRLVDKDGNEWPRMLVHAGRCPKVVKSLEEQEANPDGTPHKPPGSKWDKLSGPTDAATYLISAIFKPHEYRKPVRWK